MQVHEVSGSEKVFTERYIGGEHDTADIHMVVGIYCFEDLSITIKQSLNVLAHFQLKPLMSLCICVF